MMTQMMMKIMTSLLCLDFVGERREGLDEVIRELGELLDLVYCPLVFHNWIRALPHLIHSK